MSSSSPESPTSLPVRATPAPTPSRTAQTTPALPSSAPAITSGAEPVSTSTRIDGQTSDAVSADRVEVAHHGYTPAAAPVETPDGSGKLLYAFLSVCTGSADGHCQKVFFFAERRLLGTDTLNPSRAISGVVPAGTGSIDVIYPTYLASDPDCCPSGRRVTIRYHWNGTRLVPSGTPPGH